MLNEVGHWLNDNQGILAIILFLAASFGAFARWLLLRPRVFALKSLRPTLTVDSDRSFSGHNDHADQPELTLSYKMLDDGSIGPILPYLAKIENGERVESNFYHNTPFNLSFPKLQLDILNEGDAPVLVKAFFFQIRSSTPVKSPVPVLALTLWDKDWFVFIRML